MLHIQMHFSLTYVQKICFPMKTLKNSRKINKQVHTFFSGSVRQAFDQALFLIQHISEVEQMQKLSYGFHFGGIPPMQQAYF
jgi:hypothetical protein